MTMRLPAAVRRDLDRILTAPTADQIDRAIEAFVRSVMEVSGDDVVGVYLFGSRARGTARPDSDVDVAVVFQAAGEPDWVRLRTLSSIAYDLLLETGVHIQAHPVTRERWTADGAFALSARRDARRLS